MRASVGVVLVGLFLGDLGCQSTPDQQVSAKPAGPLSHSEFVRAARIDLNRCIHDFYADQWEGVQTHANRLVDLGSQWTEMPGRTERSADYRRQTEKFAAAAQELRAAGTAKDVVKTTLALRTLSDSLAALAGGH